MPLYVYECRHGHKFEKIKTIAEMESIQQLCDCGQLADVKIQPVMLAPMFQPYTCPITDKPIMSTYEHQENLKKHGCRVYEPGETEGIKKAQKSAEQQLDKSVEATAEEFVDKLSGDKRSQLVNEITSGVDVAFQRTTKG